ncbi:histidine kinase dimerization/phosphoacceptor domain -containing protein [Halarcobacter sp.]|uniref:histidine kinase dimerization/phosphoacceptor domain -containing protein n=1 Tax=Halarcobacter sp. TaxID=2321133 RepID=UPI0029F5113D|nr:histidine kinase dimerization/phosphoacceptor domain -containing protein [Halarcobacter sp.]
MINYLNFKYYSFTTKILISFFIFVIVFIISKNYLTLPKIEQKNYNEELDFITKTLLNTKKQLIVISDYIKIQSNLRRELSKIEIQEQLKQFDLSIKNIKKPQKIVDLFKKNYISNYCSYNFTGNNFKYEKIIKINPFEKNINKKFEKWQEYKTNGKVIYLFYNHKFQNKDLILSIGCYFKELNKERKNLKLNLKEQINTLTNMNLKTAKKAIFKIKPNMNNEEITLKKESYYISRISEQKDISIGDLSIKQILKAKDKGPIEHQIGGKSYLTWIIDLNNTWVGKGSFLLEYTVEKDEILNNSKANLSFLNETLIAIFLSFLIFIVSFGKILKDINKLTKTATLVTKGNRNIRSNVKGDNDIGILGESFDNMLDFFENNIKILDKRVEDKTNVISKSLEEKEVLLREIHHRVKNNLTLTISLIQLQELNMKDEETKKALKDIQERIFTMVLIHQKIYESKDLNRINLKNYVTDLINAIINSYSINKNLDLTINVDELELDIQSVMPLGIILNELITNAFKYAFNNQKENKLELIISNPRNKKIIIIVKDNGKKEIKDFLELSNKTLGLKLVNTIVKYQLFGEFTYKYNNGSIFEIKGEINNY